MIDRKSERRFSDNAILAHCLMGAIADHRQGLDILAQLNDEKRSVVERLAAGFDDLEAGGFFSVGVEFVPHKEELFRSVIHLDYEPDAYNRALWESGKPADPESEVA